LDAHKPTPTPPPTPASDLSSSGSRSRSRSNSTNYRNQSQSRSRSRETLTPTPRLVFPLRTSTPVPTPKSKSNSRYATASSDSINTIPIPVSIPVHTYVQQAYTHTRFQHSSASSFSSPRPKRTPLKVCTSFSSLTKAGGERDVLAPSPMAAAATTLGCCMRTGTGPGASVGASTSHKNTPSTSTSISITTESNYSHNTPSDELDVVDTDREGGGNRVDAYTHPATSGNSTGGIQATPRVSVKALDEAFRYKDTRPHGYTPERPATPTASRRLNMGAYTINNNLNKIKTARPSPGLQNARTHPHPHSYPDYSHSHSHTHTQTHISSSNSDSPHSQEQDHDHDFTDLRDPFAPRVSSFAHLVSPHYIFRASLPTHPLPHSDPHSHSDPSAPSHVQPTRMSAWGRLQFPVRLPLPGHNAGANSNANASAATRTGLGLVMPVGAVDGITTAVLPIKSGPWGITTEGHGGRVKSGKVVTGKMRSKIGRGSKERLGRHGAGRVKVNLKVKERERVLEDIDMEDSALLAQRLLRRLQRQGAGVGVES
jgi:hypothetical protein